jgi:hypothetical protein
VLEPEDDDDGGGGDDEGRNQRTETRLVEDLLVEVVHGRSDQCSKVGVGRLQKL